MNLQNDECIDISLMAGLLLTITPTREWYVLPRSTHWAQFLFSSYHFLNCEFTSNCRMSRQSFYSLHRLLQPYIQKEKTQFRETIPSERRLAIFLYHATLSVPYLAVLNQFRCGKSTVSVIVREVYEAITWHLSTRYIRFSTLDQAMRTMAF